MLPPIHKQQNGAVTTGSSGLLESVKQRGNSAATGDAAGFRRVEPDSSSYLSERMQLLERENEHFRRELVHLRQLASNNHQQQDDEKMSLSKAWEELQRVQHAFSSKVQADGLFQQREQQKAALLFAELARLGQSVETIEHTLRTVADDTRRKLDQHEQQLSLVASSVQSGGGHGSRSPTKRSQEENHCQNDEIQRMQHALSQLRTEIESDRSERWKVESERSQWAADLRAAVSKTDANVDARITSHLERVHSKLIADKIEMMRALDEYRELLTGADFKRMSSQLVEFTRINEHLVALERWIHTEHSKIKRVLQATHAANESRFQAIASECGAALKLWSGVLQQQDDDWRVQFASLHASVAEMAQHVQRKVFALEEVVPMEVRARQKHDDKLRRRVDAKVEWLARAIESTRSEVATKSVTTAVGQLQLADSTQLQSRVDALERSQTQFMQHVEKWQAAEIDPPNQQLPEKAAEVVANIDDGDATKDEQRQGDNSSPSTAIVWAGESPQAAIDSHAMMTQWRADVEQQLSQVSEALMLELTARHNDLLATIETMEAGQNDQADAISSLRLWTVTHAQECRQCYEYLQWTLQQSQDDAAVLQTLTQVVDAVCGYGCK